MIELQEIQRWLTTTISGILVLGALGSILGAIILSILMRIVRQIISKKEGLIDRLSYPLVREVDIGNEIRSEFGAITKDGKFVGFQVLDSVILSFSMNIFLLSLTLTAHVMIAYWIERPILLSALVGLNILLFREMIKKLMSSYMLIPENIRDGKRRIEMETPTGYLKWKIARESPPD